MKCGIVIFPSKTLQDLANSYRKRYDSHYTKIPPHVTLKGAFEASEDEMKEMVRKIRQVVKEVEPFTMEVYKFNSFHPVKNVVYMKIRENEALTALYEKLDFVPQNEDIQFEFVPHITIGQDLSNDEVTDIYGRLKLEKIHHVETIDRISLCSALENGTWTVYETFLLGKGE